MMAVGKKAKAQSAKFKVKIFKNEDGAARQHGGAIAAASKGRSSNRTLRNPPQRLLRNLSRPLRPTRMRTMHFELCNLNSLLASPGTRP
jgi:hypothetical protein